MNKLLLVFFLVFLSSSFLLANNRQTDWQKYSKILESNLYNDNPGVQQSAMHMIIRYNDLLSFSNKAVFKVMREFRTNKDQNVRKLALIALSKMNNDWADYYLKLHYSFEENKQIKRLMGFVILENNKV